jgi:hypothetical protein
MSTSIRAHFDGQHFVPDVPVTDLVPGDQVEVVPVMNPSTQNGNADPLLRMIDFAVDTGIADLAENADHYLYGHPKQSEETDGR